MQSVLRLPWLRLEYKCLQIWVILFRNLRRLDMNVCKKLCSLFIEVETWLSRCRALQCWSLEETAKRHVCFFRFSFFSTKVVERLTTGPRMKHRNRHVYWRGVVIPFKFVSFPNMGVCLFFFMMHNYIPLAGSCGHDNEPGASIKTGEFLTSLANFNFSKMLCSVPSLNWNHTFALGF